MTEPMPEQPLFAWLPLDTVLGHLRIESDSDDAAQVEQWRQGAAAWVQRKLGVQDASTWQPTADVRQGAVLLCARLWSRRGTPAGLASFAEFGATAILRLDPDVERLLGLGRYGRPRVG